MTSPEAGAISDKVLDSNGSFDPDLAQAYSTMSSQEYKQQWYLESVSNEESQYSSPKGEEEEEELDTRFIEVCSSQSLSPCIIPTSSEEDDLMDDLERKPTPENCIDLDDSSDTMMISTPKEVKENTPSTSSSSPKKDPPIRRQLRPRRPNQVKPYTDDRARYLAMVRHLDYDELLPADTHSWREKEDNTIEDTYEEDDDDNQDDDEDEDPMNTQEVDDEDDDSEEPIVRRGLKHMHLSGKKRHTSSPSRSNTPPNQPSTPLPIDLTRPTNHVSLWPSKSTNTKTPTVSRVYGSKKKKHRMTKPMRSIDHSSRRRAPRILEDDEDDDMENDIQQPLLEDDDIQQSPPEEDIFAFPDHPIDSPLPNAARQGHSDDVDDIFDFPMDDDPVDTEPMPTISTTRSRSTHQTAMDELKRRRQERQNANTNDDEFVVEDLEEFKPKKRKRFNMNEIPSTHGVLPRSFGIVAKRMEERPKPVAQMESLDDQDDHDSLSSLSADEFTVYSNEYKRQLLPEFFQSTSPSHFGSNPSPRQPQQHSYPSLSSSSRIRKSKTSASSSNSNRHSSSRASNSKVQLISGSSNSHQKPSRKRRQQRNKLDGIYIHRRDPDCLPSLPKFGRGDPSRRHIPYLDSDDDMESDTNISSRPYAPPTSTTFNSPSIATNSSIQHAFQPLPALSSPPTPIHDPFVEFLESHQPFTYDFNTIPSQYTGSLPGTRYIGRGFLANLFDQEQPLAMFATQVFGEELPTMDSSDDTMPPAYMDYASLQRLMYKCFHHLASYIERDVRGFEQDFELRKFTCIYHFLSWSIMVQGRSLPGYFEKEIECLVQRVLTLNGKKAPSKWVILILVYYMDWKRRLHPSLNDSRASHLLLEHLYRLGPDQVHIQVDEARLTAVNALAVEAWITLLKFETDHGQLWHTIWEWIEHDEALAEWDKVERAWHWLFVIRVMQGFDIHGKLSTPPRQDSTAWPGISQLVASSRQLAGKCSPKYDQYAQCLRKRWRSL